MTSSENLQAPAPSSALKQLGRLVGKWNISGESSGTVTYEWMEGGFFLLQYVDMGHDENHVKGIEVIGHERPFGAEAPSEDIKSRFYGSKGETLDYVYELEGDTLTIWGQEKGSPAYFRGTFGDNDRTLNGGWVWPGGGYTSNMTRAE